MVDSQTLDTSLDITLNLSMSGAVFPWILIVVIIGARLTINVFKNL